MLQNILYTLISKGISEYNTNIDEINRILRPMAYEAVPWCDKSCLVLKDYSGMQSCPWKDSQVTEIKNIIEKLATNNQIEAPNIDCWIGGGWLERDGDKIVLSKRTLVQFEDYILKLNGRYKKCELCKLLTDETTYHSYCRNLIEGKRAV